MHFLIACLISLSHAASLEDLMFLTQKEQYNGNLRFSYLNFDEEHETPSTTSTEVYETNRFSLTPSLMYGYSNNFSFGGNLTYYFTNSSRKSEETTNGLRRTPGLEFNNQKYKNDGLHELRLSARYRFYKSKSLLADFFGELSPKLGSKTLGQASDATGNTVDGNAKNGAHMLYANILIGNPSDDNQWRLKAQVKGIGEEEVTYLNADGGGETVQTTDARFDLALAGDLQAVVREDFILGGGAGFDYLAEQDTEATNVQIVTDSVFSPYLHVFTKITPQEGFLLQLLTRYYFSYERDKTTTVTGSASPVLTTIETKGHFDIQFWLKFLF